ETRPRTQLRVQPQPPTADGRTAGGGTTPASPAMGATGGAGTPAPGTGGTTGGTGGTTASDSNFGAHAPTTAATEQSLRLPDTNTTGRQYATPDEEIADLTRQKLDLRQAAERIRKAHEELAKRARPLTERR